MRRIVVVAVLSTLALALAFAQEGEQDAEKVALRKKIEGMMKNAMNAIEKLRGHEYRKKVPLEIPTRGELEKMMLKQFEEETRPGELEKAERVLLKFGVWEKGKNIKELMVAMLKKGVAGMYSPKEKKFMVIKDVAGRLDAPMVVAHELLHAMQDQQFDLWAFMRHIIVNDDRMLAHQAVVEGEATLLGIDYMVSVRRRGKSVYETGGSLERLVRMNFAMQQRPKNLPRVLFETLIFPYLHGSVLVDRYMRREGGYKKNDYLFLWPPLSTEQILHPEKYLDPEKRDLPTEIRLRDPVETLGEKEYESIGAGVVGEFLLRVIGRHFVDEKDGLKADEPVKMADGWDGDFYVIMTHKKSDRDILFWPSTWDSEDEAKEFVDCYLKCLKKKYGKEAWCRDDTACFWVKAGELVWVERKGADVLVVEGADADELRKLRELAAKAEKYVATYRKYALRKEAPKLPEEPAQKEPPKPGPEPKPGPKPGPKPEPQPPEEF